MSAEEAGMEIESAGVGELFERLTDSPSEYFVDAYFEYNASSSYSEGNLGSFDDCRGR